MSVLAMEFTRAFVAIDLGWGTTGILERVIKHLKSQIPDVRWSLPEQLHLTLKFVGEVDNRELPQLCEKVRAACAQSPPFSLQLKGIGAFPLDKPPRVLWVGVDEGTDQLRALAERLDEKLSGLGIPRETRQFKPHLTLGRIGRNADVDKLHHSIAPLADQIAIRCEIDEVILMASIKQRAETIYEPIDTVELKG